MRTRAQMVWTHGLRWSQDAARQAARQLRKRLPVVCALVMLLSLALPATGSSLGLGGFATVLAKSPKPSHSPTTSSSFQKAADAAKQRQHAPKWTSVQTQGPRVYSGLTPAKAPRSTGTVRTHPASVKLDARFLKGRGGKPGTIHWYKSSEGVLQLGVPEGALDLSAVRTSSTTPSTSSTPTATSAATSTPASGSSATPSPTSATPTSLASPAANTSLSHSSLSARTETDPAPPTYTLELTQTSGTVQADTAVIGTYTLQVVDDQDQPVEGAELEVPITVVFHYSDGELNDLNPDSFLLSWPQTGDEATATPAAAVPLTLDTNAQTLTGSVSTLQPGPMVLSAGIADANEASSEHLTNETNLGDIGFSIPIDLPPAAGGLVPPLQLVYSSGGPNGRHSRQAPAGAVGDGWDLSLGSITYDASTGLYYLNDVGGMSEALLCCMQDAAGVNYFVPHHHPDIHVYTLNNTNDPQNDTHSTAFTVLTPDGMEYRLGWKTSGGSTYTVVNGSRRATVSGSAKQWYEWDVNEVVRRTSTSNTDSYLQHYNVDFWQDNSTSGGISYTRDAYIKDVLYNYDSSGTAHARVLFNIHWPGATTTDSATGATATTYGTNFNCTGPYQSTTLRCDDPGSPSGWVPAPLTMSTITVDQVKVQVLDSASVWQTMRTYDLSYNADDPWTQCWEQFSGQNIGCSGEHTLHSVTETAYQSGTAEPSRQPITFNYTAKVKNEYHDITVLDSSSQPLNGQTWWRYLNGFTDKQTGVEDTISYQVGYGNTHGVPSGQNVLDPLTCSQSGVTCTNADDRQWPRHLVTQIHERGTNTDTFYSYQLNNPCGATCTQDTWIPPNAYNACSGSAQAPANPNQACLTTGSANFYNEEYAGFAAVTVTHPDNSSTVTSYWAGAGWGTNDWADGNRLRSMARTSKVYAGSPSGNSLRQVDATYSDGTTTNCPATSGATQLYKNPYLMCQVYQTQQVTTFWEGNSSGTTVPTLTQNWTYDPTSTGTNHYHTSLTSSSVTGNDLIADSYPTRTTTPTFTSSYLYAWNDQMAAFSGGHPTTYFYQINMPAQTILADDLGAHWACAQTRYDAQGYVTGQQNSMVDGLPTESDAYADCGTSPSYTLAGAVSSGAGYDNYGQSLVASDADAFAGISGHAGCSASVTPLKVGAPSGATSYTSCTTYDSVQHAYPTAAANALNQQAAATFDVVQGVQLTATDPNSQVVSTPAPVYEYNGSATLGNFQDIYSDTKLPGETASWSTRTFAFSFCVYAGAFISGVTTPCLEMDTVQQLDGTNLTVSRSFYDRAGRLVETRASGPDSSHDVVAFTSYDDVNDKVFTSLPCTVAALSTSNGGRSVTSTAGYIAPAAVSTGSGAYVDPTVSGTSCYNIAGSVTYSDTLGRTIAADDALGTGAGTSGTGCLVGSVNHTTCAYYQVAAASTSYGMPASDTAVYLRTVNIDANLHQGATYFDALGRTSYSVGFIGSGQSPLSGVTYYATVADQYDPDGNLRVIKHPNGAQTTYTFDKLGRKTATSDPDLGAWAYTYDANGNMRSSTDPRGSGSGTSTMLAGVSTVGSILDGDAAGSAEAFNYTATTSGTANSLSLYLDSGSAATSVIVGLYADNGNSGSPQPTTLLAQATISSPQAGAWNTVSLPAVSVTSGQKYWIAVLSPSGGNSIAFREVGSSGASVGSSSSTLTTLPSTWSTGTGFTGSSLSAYVSQTSSGGAAGVVYANYDGLDRQLWRNTSDTSSGAYVTYSYDSVASGNKGVGRLTGESFTGGTSAHVLSGSYGFTYDVRGQLTQQKLANESSTNYTLGFGYNDAGMETSLTYTDGEVLRENYNTSGWLNAVTTTPSGGSAVNLLTNLSFGGPALQLTGASLGNGTYTYAASYDNDGRGTNLQLTRSSDSGTVFRSARSYDAASNVVGVTTTLTTGTDVQAFCYDALDRLTWAGSTGTPSCGGTLTAGTLTSAQYTQTFGYDTLDRLTSMTSSGATGSSPGSYTYGDSAHLHAATATAGGYSATYDAAGDMLCRAPTSATTCTGGSPTGAQLANDAERRLTHYQDMPGSSPNVEAWYLYDGDGNRVEQAVKQSGVTTSTYYLAGGAEEVRSDGSLIKYYSAGRMALGLNTGAAASTISYTASDGLGSLQVSLNGSGSATALQLNAPYGSVRYSNGVFPTTKGFTGQRSDAAVSGLDYYGARYYDPRLGQFISADAVLDGLNRYAYVGGNPETDVDPSGHMLWATFGYGGSSSLIPIATPVCTTCTNYTTPTGPKVPPKNGGSGGGGGGGGGGGAPVKVATLPPLKSMPIPTPKDTSQAPDLLNQSTTCWIPVTQASCSSMGVLMVAETSLGPSIIEGWWNCIANSCAGGDDGRNRDDGDGWTDSNAFQDRILFDDAGGGAGARAGADQRWDGPKPEYTIDDEHLFGTNSYNEDKTPLAPDAEEVYKHAVPAGPNDPNRWFGLNDRGDVYVYHGDKIDKLAEGQRQQVHFFASTGDKPRAPGGKPYSWNNIPQYVKARLGIR